jgi:hypothetical protein
VTGTVIFVFGSNLAGRHGAGAALAAARQWGAGYGCGVGLQGHSYAIPTKDGRDRSIPLSDPRQTLPLDVITGHVATFIAFARLHPEWTFRVTPIGCGLAGHKPADIAPMFRDAPENCQLPPEFLRELVE